jgi:hypothetical protein
VLASLAVIVGIGALSGRWVVVGPVLAVAAYRGVVTVRSAAARLQVDRGGISFAHGAGARRDRRFVPWGSVRELAVDERRVTVRLRADAPMPPWMRGRVLDPADPASAGTLAQDVPGLDVGALQRTVVSLGVGVPVLVGDTRT